MSAQVLLNLLNELSLFCNELYKELRALRGTLRGISVV